MKKRLGLLLAAALLGAAMLPATTAAAGNLGHQGTKTAPVTVHCYWDANSPDGNDDVYEVLWTVAPDVLVQIGNTGQEGAFLIWAAASGKYSAPSVFLDGYGYNQYETFYGDLFGGPDWPSGYITVQAVVFNLDYSTTVIASGTAKCQRADINVS
jgi:hypothetical protein